MADKMLNPADLVAFAVFNQSDRRA